MKLKKLLRMFNPDVKLRATFMMSIAKELEAARKERMNTKPSFQ